MEKLWKICGLFRAGRRGGFLCLGMMGSVVLGFAQKQEPIFNFAEYKIASVFTVPDDDSGKEKAVSGNTGLRLSFRDADVRGYVTLPKTEMKAIEDAENWSELKGLLNEPRYGAGVFLFKDFLPVTMKAGHNTYSKSVSKIKNPSPSVTANPLANSFAFATGCGASLPTLTSSVQPFSYSIAFSSGDMFSPIQFWAESFINERKEGVASVSGKFSLSRSVFLQAAVSGGRYNIENNSSILKKNNADFTADFYCSGLGEFCFHSPLLKLNFYSGIHESPYETNPFWFKIDGRTSFRSLLLNFSYFAIPTTKDSPKVVPLISSSGICRTVEQASVNPQILFLFDDKNASSLRLGFSALENWKVTATNKPVQLNTAKFRAAASFESRFFTLRFDWTHANILLSGEPPTKSAFPEEYYSYGASSGFIGKTAKLSVSGSYANYPPVTETSAKKETFSADLKIAVPKLNFTAQTGVDLTYKDGERYAGEFSTGLSYALKRKFFRASMKAEVKIGF